jgi:expansin (peptidoglycan-binding protein)
MNRSHLHSVAVSLGLLLAAACSGEPTTSNTSTDGGGGGGNEGGGGNNNGGNNNNGGGTPVPLGESHDGVATFYSATGAGNCSFDASPNDLDVAAMDAPEYAGSAVCGECVAITGPKGKLTVRIVDKCPECPAGHLDLSAEAFAKIANPADGKVKITWQAVACSVSGNVSYHYKDGSNPFWTAIQVRNHRLPITKLEIKKSGAYVAVKREDYNYFVDPSGAGNGTVSVRITASDGQTLEDTLSPVASDTTVQGSGQFK